MMFKTIKLIVLMSIFTFLVIPVKAQASVNSIFAEESIDTALYNKFDAVAKTYLKSAYGNRVSNTKLESCFNPCFAFATTWGEAGASNYSVSNTTVMDFTPSRYEAKIRWADVVKNIECVDEYWYITFADNEYNKGTKGNAYQMPVGLLQYPSEGSRETANYVSLGVGPYQITSSDWTQWPLTNRVSPLSGWDATLRKAGTLWIDAARSYNYETTIYACSSLAHQGGGLFKYDFSTKLFQAMDKQEVHEAIVDAGTCMYNDFLVSRQKGSKGTIAQLNLSKYNKMVVDKTGIDFSKFSGGVGSTNKGNYTLNHTIRYVFYKLYFNGGIYEETW